MKHRNENSLICHICFKLFSWETRLKIGEFLAKFIKPTSSWMSNGPRYKPDLISAGFIRFIPEYDYDAHVFPVKIETAQKYWPENF